MAQTVQDENGNIHSFPDEATPDQMEAAINSSAQPTNWESKVGDAGRNFVGGILSGVKGLAQLAPIASNISQLTSGIIPSTPWTNKTVNNFDPYKAVGTTDQPIASAGGLEQLAGQLFMPGGFGVKAGAEGAKAAGGVIPLAEKALTGTENLAGKIGDMFSPAVQSSKLLDDLGNGAANTQESGASIVKDIQNAHDANNAQASSFLDYPLNIAGKEKIYPTVDPLVTTNPDNQKIMNDSLNAINPGKIDNLFKDNEQYDTVGDLKFGDLFDKFRNNPSFQNAHNLQSELGNMVGQLQSIPGKTIAQNLELKQIDSVRNNLKNDISTFLQKRDLNSNDTLAPMYQKGIDLYRDTVAPYLSSNKLRSITRGGQTMVNNVENIFKNPSDVFNRFTGQTQPGAINKILSDLPQSTKNQILFNRLGGNTNSENPEALISSINNADQKGFSHLISPDLRGKVNNIQRAINNKNILKYAGGGIGTATAGAGAYGLGSNLYRNLLNGGQS